MTINLKNNWKKVLFQFSFHFTMPISPSVIYGILLQLMVRMTTAKRTLFEGIHIELQASEQRTAITCVQFARTMHRGFNNIGNKWALQV